MKKRSLRQTNPHLHDPIKVKQAISRMVESSSAIEGINVKVKVVNGDFTVTVKPPSKK